jgi:hypothetical protein
VILFLEAAYVRHLQYLKNFKISSKILKSVTLCHLALKKEKKLKPTIFNKYEQSKRNQYPAKNQRLNIYINILKLQFNTCCETRRIRVVDFLYFWVQIGLRIVAGCLLKNPKINIDREI